MPLLDEIKQLQGQGYNEQDISQKMMEGGYNPKEINDAISQSRIKAAVSEEAVQNSVINASQEMQPSLLAQPPQEQQQPQEYTYPTPQAYPTEYQYYQPQVGVGVETITEISEQVVAEKLSEIKKIIGNIADFKTITESKISGIDERLRRIETIIENLQARIIGKIGNYGQAVQDIKTEMEAMQDSFSKVINPLISKTRETEELQEPEEEVKKERKKGKKQDFSDYLRP